jgi:phage terminase large subunit-like protein
LADRNGDCVFIYTPPSMRMRAKTQARDPLYCAKLFKRYSDDPRWLCMTATSHDNPNISEEGLRSVAADLTSLGYRQEIMAEDIDEVPGALWTPKMIEDDRVEKIPEAALPLVRVVVGLDPSGSASNEAGIVGAGKGRDGHGYVFADKSVLAATPRIWGQETVWLYYESKADRIVGERNYGGDMIAEVIKTVDPNVSYRDVTATRGKQVRAEPIVALYEKHIVHHVGQFPKLEEEQCSYVPDVTKQSPNRMDALVWAMTDLFPESLRLTLVESRLDEMKKTDDARKEKIAVQTSTLTKPVRTDQMPDCPNCSSTAIVRRGPLQHCNSCGHEWGFTPPAATGGRAGLQK